MDGVTWQVDSSENKHCWPRWLMASLARTEYVCVMDDDLVPADDAVLSDMLRFLKAVDGDPTKAADSPCVVGPFGMAFDEDGTKPYHAGMHMNANMLPTSMRAQKKYSKEHPKRIHF